MLHISLNHLKNFRWFSKYTWIILDDDDCLFNVHPTVLGISGRTSSSTNEGLRDGGDYGTEGLRVLRRLTAASLQTIDEAQFRDSEHDVNPRLESVLGSSGDSSRFLCILLFANDSSSLSDNWHHMEWRRLLFRNMEKALWSVSRHLHELKGSHSLKC